MPKPAAWLLVLVLPLLACSSEASSTPSGAGVTGTVLHHEDFPSDWVDARNVDVWLPPDYSLGARRYPVIYMHDGQNLFDPDHSYIGVDWGVDEAMTDLFEQTDQAAIVVAIWNTPKRFPEYMPQKMAEKWTPAQKEEVADYGRLEDIESDAYVRFLTEELKPWVDAEYRTLPDRESTMIMGSSMGGLISLYALTERPDVFGAVGAISTHWPAAGEGGLEYLASRLPEPGAHRILFDYGTEALDASYQAWQPRVDSLMNVRGFSASDWTTIRYAGHDHSERSWKRRMPATLAWLLGERITSEVDGRRLLGDQAYLSSEALGGRGAGSKGGEAARHYVRAAFESTGMESVTEQPFVYSGDRQGVNVIGQVAGTDPAAGYFVLTAHFDHLGERGGEVYNGADDNASGTAALMELARQITERPLRHSVVFAAVDAEEQGLQGARAYVAEPSVPLEEVHLNLNMDMISRSEAYEVYVAGTYHYPRLRALIEPMLPTLPVRVLFGHDLPGTGSDDWSSASDHGPFHEVGIPFLYFGVEDHAGYHNPTDDFEDTTPAFYLETVVAIQRILRELDTRIDGRVGGRDQ